MTLELENIKIGDKIVFKNTTLEATYGPIRTVINKHKDSIRTKTEAGTEMLLYEFEIHRYVSLEDAQELNPEMFI